MFSLNIKSENIYIKDIKIDDLKHLVNWYNNINHFVYATGVDKPMSISQFTKKYFEILKEDNEFFVGIFKKNTDKMMGVLKGQLKEDYAQILWISSIFIIPEEQYKGYGGETIELLIDYLRKFRNTKTIYLSVAKSNIKGINFWIKHSFVQIDNISKSKILMGRSEDLIVMCRSI